MVEKGELLYDLRRLERRVICRSETRVASSLFFHVLHSVLIEMNNKNEDELEDILNKGRIAFAHYEYPYKVTFELRIVKVVDEKEKDIVEAETEA